MKKQSATLVLALALAPLAQAAAPQVSITDFRRAGRTVVISYDLDGDGIVTADIVTNGVSIGGEKFASMYGDVNKAIAAGSGKKIYWSPEVDMNNEIATNAYAKLTAWALDAPPNYCVLDLAIKSNITYYVSAEAVPLGVTNNIYKTDRMVFRKIPAKGVQYRMGTPNNTSAEIPHRVTFTNDFYLSIYETTMRQVNLIWTDRTWCGSAYPKKDYTGADADFWMGPLTNINMTVFRGACDISPRNQGGTLPQNGSNGYLARLSDFTGAVLDLPTEAQWEFSCRAGSAEQYYWGSDSSGDLGDYAWYSGSSESKPHIVGLKEPNAWGLYDMYGNVGERCTDYYYTGSNYSNGSDVIEPYGYISGSEVAKTERVIRGGTWKLAGSDCRSAVRVKYWPNEAGQTYGYRIWMRPQAYVK